MSKVSSVNQVVAGGTGANGGAGAVAIHITNLVAAGWTIKAYGTGTSGTYSSTGSGWTSASLTTNNNAWVRAQEPGGIREWLWQVLNTAGGSWRIKYSASAKFTGGSPSATVVSSATDEIVELGSGTDASPTGATLITTPASAMRVHSVAENSAVNGAYPWVFWIHTSGTTTLQCVMFQDVVIVGSADATDTEPVVTYASAGLGGVLNFWTGFGTGGAAKATMTLASSQLCFDGARAADPTSSKDVAGRYVYYSATIFKGYSHWVLLKGMARAHPNTINKTTDCRAYVGGAAAGVLLAFPDNTDPVL